MSVSPLYYVCFLNNFNNYFNRIIKGYATLAEYQSAVGEGNYFLYSKAINYNPNDSVSTEIIMNDCPFEPDYLLILNSDMTIKARWFVLESVFTREKQKKFNIRRDVIYDFREQLQNSPMFVQKGMLNDSDSFILNSEGMSFNQIKKEETLLKDRTNSAWIVGYIAKDAGSDDPTIQAPDEDFDYITLSAIASDLGISESTLSGVLNFDGQNNNPSFFTKSMTVKFGASIIPLNGMLGTYALYINLNPELSALTGSFYEYVYFEKCLWRLVLPTSQKSPVQAFGDEIVNNKANIYPLLTTIFNRPYLTQAQYDKLGKYRNKIILYNGIYYKMSIVVADSSLVESSANFNYNTYTPFKNAIDAACNYISVAAGGKNPDNTGIYSLRQTSIRAFIQMEEISPEEGIIPAVQTKISSSRKTVANQAFDMFCIPYGAVKFNSDLGHQISTPDNALTIGAQIALELDAKLYDLQLLPYCPLLSKFDNNNEIDLTDLTEDEDFNYIDKTSARIRTTITLTNVSIGEDPDNPGQYILTGSTFIPDITTGDILSTGYTAEGNDVSNIGAASITKITTGTGVTLALTGWAYNDEDNDFTISVWYEVSGTAHQSFILWATQASFSIELNYQLSLRDSMKVESQCNSYRLNSPNYQGSFNFNVARNGGSVDFFIAECTYKPYTPYIKVAPQFSYLYGTNFGDCRGLVCGGDFSLPRFNSAWESYQLNNKNYQNIFNREIQNLDFTQDLQMRQQLITGGTGIATSGIVGAGVGAQAGGVYGAIAGAVLGSAGSAVGMAIDTDMLARQQRENRSISIDKYNYQLGNIKALPYTLTKVGSFDINSKIWPFLEYYSCTDEEKAALENKIRYESMTVMRIDLIGQYFGAFDEARYLKGELIRNEEIAEDNHIFEAIYAEFVKGVYC